MGPKTCLTRLQPVHCHLATTNLPSSRAATRKVNPIPEARSPSLTLIRSRNKFAQKPWKTSIVHFVAFSGSPQRASFPSFLVVLVFNPVLIAVQPLYCHHVVSAEITMTTPYVLVDNNIKIDLIMR